MVDTMPGFNVFAGADLTGSMGLLHHPEHPPKIILNSFYYVVGDQVLRFFLTGDKYFDLQHKDGWQVRRQPYSSVKSL